MKLNIHAFHFDLTDEIRDYTAEKIGNLEKYYNNIIMADVKLESQGGDTANVRYICTVQLSVPGEDLFAEDRNEDIFKAVNNVEEELKKQIRKKKDKQNPRKMKKIQNALKGFFGKE